MTKRRCHSNVSTTVPSSIINYPCIGSSVSVNAVCNHHQLQFLTSGVNILNKPLFFKLESAVFLNLFPQVNEEKFLPFAAGLLVHDRNCSWWVTIICVMICSGACSKPGQGNTMCLQEQISLLLHYHCVHFTIKWRNQFHISSVTSYIHTYTYKHV